MDNVTGGARRFQLHQPASGWGETSEEFSKRASFGFLNAANVAWYNEIRGKGFGIMHKLEASLIDGTQLEWS
jgi:hypothetical protein